MSALPSASSVIAAPDDTMLRRLMSLPDVKLGVGIPPKTAIAVHADGNTSVLGSGNIAVFRKP